MIILKVISKWILKMSSKITICQKNKRVMVFLKTRSKHAEKENTGSIYLFIYFYKPDD